MNTHTNLKPDECPCCLHNLNASTGLGHGIRKPRALDFSICLYCGSVLRYDENTNLRAATEDEIEQDLSQEQQHQIQVATRMIKERNGTNRI